MQTLARPDEGMELCYECVGKRSCIMCDGAGKIGSARCTFCGGQRRCIVCNGAGQLPEGMYQDLVARGLIKPTP